MMIEEWTGTEISIESAVGIINALEKDFGFTRGPVLRSTYNALNELLLNVRHHAYPSELGVVDCFWKISLVKREDKLIHIIVEDHGISIPASMFEKIKSYKLDAHGVNYSDTELINKAVKMSEVSQFNGRGMGFKSILMDVDKGYINSFFITSRNGYFEYSPVSNGSSENKFRYFNGTKIEIIISGEVQ
ncbi:ATP-binding protein [uncultured Enterobacter sp.]|uniref:ATP-binding protein n=1 Tax=uncultured Enterobacter sp. TaxID=238202 RepID=UPI00258F0523|nr:ATP-binding protein [uncultured Enterobacter sp.]